MSGDELVDHSAETQCGATELGVVIPETGPQLAYSQELPALDYPEPASRARVALIAGSMVAAAGLVVGAVLFIGWNRHESAAPVASSPTQTTSPAQSPLAASAPPTPVPVTTITTVIMQSTIAQKSVAPKAPPPPPQAARVMSTWSYDVQWGGGAPGINVVEHGSYSMRTLFVTDGASIGTGTGWTGEVIGVDPILTGAYTWASCTLYVDGRVAKTSYAARGDGKDVSCLVRLTR